MSLLHYRSALSYPLFVFVLFFSVRMLILRLDFGLLRKHANKWKNLTKLLLFLVSVDSVTRNCVTDRVATQTTHPSGRPASSESLIYTF
jgi:hypothetical protein